MQIDGRDIRRRGCLFIVSGPSGAGKTSICTPVLATLRDISLSVSYTTRKPRKGEHEGVDYRYVDGATFDRDGTRVFGPAPRDLDQFQISLDDGMVAVDTGKLICGSVADSCKRAPRKLD